MEVKRPLIVILALFICNLSFGQGFDWAVGAGDWGDDSAIGLTTDFEGNVLLTGRLSSGTSIGNKTFEDNGAYLVKYTSTGSVDWVKSFGTFSTTGVDVVTDPAGNIYLAGTYSHSFTIEGVKLPGGSQARIFLGKFNKYGDFLWIKDFGTISNSGRSRVRAIDIDANNNIYLGGSFDNPINLGDSVYTVRGRESFDSDMLLIKLSSDGDVLSVKNPGSTATEYIYDIAVNSSGIYAVGYLRGIRLELDDSVYNSPKNELGFILRYSHKGELDWVNTFNAPYFSEAFSITLDDMGEAIVAGMWSEGVYDSMQSIFVSKVDANGNILNNQLIKHPGHFGGYGYNLSSSGRNIYLTASLTHSTKIDHLNFNSSGSRDVAILKLNEIGYPQWMSVSKGTGNDVGSVIYANGKSIYVAGGFASNQLMLGETIIYNNSGNTYYDFFLAKSVDSSSNLCPDIEDFFITHGTAFCEGDSIQLSIENAYATYTEWFRDGEKLNLDNRKQIYIKEEGVYEVLINHNSSCPVPAMKIIVDPESNQDAKTDVVIYAKPKADITGMDQVCVGDTLLLLTPSNEDYLYSWNIPDSYQHTDTTLHDILIEINALQSSATFYLEVENKLTGCINGDSIIVEIHPSPNIDLQLSDNTITVYNDNAELLQWFYEGAELPDFKNSESINVEQAGNYYVMGTNAFGCSSISDSIFFERALSVNNDPLEKGTAVYPNPTTDFLFLNYDSPPERVEVTGISGSLIKVNLNTSYLNLKDLKAGLYFIRIFSKGSVKTVKVFKE